MIIDFRRNPSNEPKHKTIIENKEVETVSSYKYLGTTFDDKLKWSNNTDDIVKKCNQRIYFLRKLNSFGVDKKVTKLLCSSFIESVLCFSFICWFGNLDVKQKNKIKKIVNMCSKVIGKPLRSLSVYYNRQVVKKARAILACPNHALHEAFGYLPSQRRLRSVMTKSNRRRDSFVPTAVRLLNDV